MSSRIAEFEVKGGAISLAGLLARPPKPRAEGGSPTA